jgi:hypothetical protein
VQEANLANKKGCSRISISGTAISGRKPISVKFSVRSDSFRGRMCNVQRKQPVNRIFMCYFVSQCDLESAYERRWLYPSRGVGDMGKGVVKLTDVFGSLLDLDRLQQKRP